MGAKKKRFCFCSYSLTLSAAYSVKNLNYERLQRRDDIEESPTNI